MVEFAVPVKGYSAPLQSWIDWILEDHQPAGLMAQLADDVVFYSPVVFTPQKGREITTAYLVAADSVLGGSDGRFKYVRIYDAGNKAALEFETTIDGKYVNGVDMIEWNEQGKMIEFKVMVRPLQAVNAIHAEMGAMLEKMKQGA